MKILCAMLALFLIGTETIFAAPLLDMANIPERWAQMLVAFGIVTGSVVCLEYALAGAEKAKSWQQWVLPALIFIFLTAFLICFGLMRGLMTYTLSHGQLQLFLMGTYWLNLAFWGLLTFLPPLAAALLFHHVRKEEVAQ